ncbi:isopeptide-forming domain-containing fimbrial protein [Blautia sp. AF34-10]|uniref:SpaH/EbpB family LPXTG-anchored major pilin n=1 Tax=Blautia sp. AF34-10 TaxID=2292968 RepID=UPI000E5C6D97|nr:SpaH/EbpB family LPXTG-anchored major pilin [Blautia sp. AF34-10]RHP30131.1 isopeptide-forming domain-containing fimbrial protein [Blautia sp. AF34-10]
MKKLVSRFMAVLMAMTMILSMSMTAFAAEAPKGTLTVNNTVAGKTLDLYQIFSATKSGDNVAYTLNSAYEGFFQSKISGASTLTGEALSEKAYAYVKDQVGTDGSNGAAFAKDIMGWILGNTATVEATHTTATTTDTTTVINNLDYGYYVVYPLGATDTSTAPGNETVKSVASLVSVTGTDATVNMKSNYPTVVKKVNDKNADDVNIGDTVTYTLTSKVPDMTGYTSYVFNFKDTLAKGLTFGSITSVKIGDVTINADTDGTKAENTYTLTTKNNKDGTTEIKIELNKFLASNANKAGQEIKVTYTATLNKDAVTGFDPNTNKATVEYSNKPGTEKKGESEPSIVDVHTFDFTIFKYYTTNSEGTETKNPLKGAEFELYKANAEGTAADEQAKINIVDEGNGVYRQATAEEAKATDFTSAKIVSDADGKVLVKGLDAGTYYLRETKAPEGYNKLLSDITVVIKAHYDEITGKLKSYSVDYTYNGKTTNGTAITDKDNHPEVAVENKTGAQLPSTGSKGALMVTLAGIVLFGVLTASKAFGKKKAKN